jgi:hypothetical protein
MTVKLKKWNSMASRISLSTSSRVCPVATQPSRSGEYAEYPVLVSSMTIGAPHCEVNPPGQQRQRHALVVV